jgi:integrase/recombinase XerD
MGWELHAIAAFAGHRSTDSTLRYIHLSGRELSEKLASSMSQIHAWRVSMLTRPSPAPPRAEIPRDRGRAGGACRSAG